MTARSIAAALVALAACKSEPPAPAPPPPPTPPGAQRIEATAPRSAGPRAKDLGGGYKEAKWGMSPAQVEGIFGTPTKKEADPALPDRMAYAVFALKDDGQQTKRELVAYFLDGSLFRAMLLPNFSPGFGAGLDSLEAALSTKYGPGEAQGGPDAGRRALSWDDGTTHIDLVIPLMPAADAAARKITDRRLAEGAAVTYSSKAHVLVADEAIRARLRNAAPAAAAAPAQDAGTP